MSVSAERFEQGMTLQEYMAQMSENAEEFASNYANVEIDPDDASFIANLGLPLNVMVITEDWCSDTLLYLPALARLADSAESWNIRLFLRDQNLDLIDQYLNMGKLRSIPVFVFFDQDMRELAVFIERPAIANAERQEIVEALAAENPLVEPGKAPRDQSEEAWTVIGAPLKELREGRKAGWQQAAVDEIREALQEVAVARTLAEH